MKKFLLIPIAVLALVVSGCTNTATQKNTSNSPKVTKVAATSYQDLNKTNQKNLQFKFNPIKIKSSSDGTLNYKIALTITNQTKKAVQFDLDKFGIYTSQQKIVKADKSGTLILKAGQTKTINNLMTKVNEKSFVGGSYFIYANKDHKLADIIFAKASNDSKTETK